MVVTGTTTIAIGNKAVASGTEGNVFVMYTPIAVVAILGIIIIMFLGITIANFLYWLGLLTLMSTFYIIFPKIRNYSAQGG